MGLPAASAPHSGMLFTYSMAVSTTPYSVTLVELCADAITGKARATPSASAFNFIGFSPTLMKKRLLTRLNFMQNKQQCICACKLDSNCKPRKPHLWAQRSERPLQRLVRFSESPLCLL